MARLQLLLLFLVSLYQVLVQSSPPRARYTLRVLDVSPVRLSCDDSSTGAAAHINDVTFWRNRTLPSDPGLSLREGRDMPVFVDPIENDISFILTREFEGYYTCGRQLMGRVDESTPVPLISRQPFTNIGGSFVFYAVSRNQAVLHCPIQSGKLVQYYYGRWEKDGTTLVELPQPINGNPQEIWRSESRYDLDATTFSLIINSVSASDAGDTYQCILNVVDPRNNLPIHLQTGTVHLTLVVNAEPEILSEIQINNGVTAFLDDSAYDHDRLPSFTCAAAGLPAPNITWIYIPNLDREHEISLSDGEKYQIIVSNISEKDDGRRITTNSVIFLELTDTDGGLVRCRASSQPTAQVASADAHFTVIGQPDHIDVLVSTKGEFIYDVALPVLLQYPVKLNISYVDQSRQFSSPGRLTTTEYNDTNSILYREVDTGQLPYEKYFVRISIVAEFENKRIEGPPLTSSELIDTTKPYAEVVIFGLSGGFATTLLIILVILPCVTAIGCCVYHHRKAGCRGGSYCRVSQKSTVV